MRYFLFCWLIKRILVVGKVSNEILVLIKYLYELKNYTFHFSFQHLHKFSIKQNYIFNRLTRGRLIDNLCNFVSLLRYWLVQLKSDCLPFCLHYHNLETNIEFGFLMSIKEPSPRRSKTKKVIIIVYFSVPYAELKGTIYRLG